MVNPMTIPASEQEKIMAGVALLLTILPSTLKG